ncbi:MAG TPA: succinylglutamate desuccinylase/aspartoacylase family protein [Woeseiaceae bacterium]|nr:succinylglutamate desuccinylase/aspartoacylase family protein [Woeseiaceae bacterium]
MSNSNRTRPGPATPARGVLVRLGTALCIALAATAASADEWGAIELLGREIHAGTNQRFAAVPDRTFEASYLNMPVFVARGATPGPALCITAGVHGDELNGVEIARRAFSGIDAGSLRGTVIVLPAINAEGVRSGNRYLSDRRDLNRAFPGSTGGSVARLIAHRVFTEVLVHCDALVDLHTASNERTNLPQVRADIADPDIEALAIHFGIGIVIAGKGPNGSLRREAAKAGIPAIIYEAGAPHRFEPDEIMHGVEGIGNLMAYLGMSDRPQHEIPESRVYERSRWIRAPRDNGGFFFPSSGLGEVVTKGQVLGEIVDPLTDAAYPVLANVSGEIIGMALSRPVLPGYALYHIAWHTSD